MKNHLLGPQRASDGMCVEVGGATLSNVKYEVCYIGKELCDCHIPQVSIY